MVMSASTNMSHSDDSLVMLDDNISLQAIHDYIKNDLPVQDCFSFSYEYSDFTQRDIVREIFVCIYVVVIILSVLGNLMVMYTVWRNKHMRTTINYYIVNLAVCDFLVGSFVMPLKLLEYVAPCAWQVFGHTALCSIVSFILPVVVFASVLTLVAISIERYERIVNPLKSLSVSSSRARARGVLAITWILPTLFASPYLFCQSYTFNIRSKYGSISRQICNDRFDDIDRAMYGPEHSGIFRKGYFHFLFLTIYLIPLIVIVSTCIRIAMRLLQPVCIEQQKLASGMRMTGRREESKRRVAKMVIAVALSFIVCWSPFYWVSLVSQVQQYSFLRQSNFLFTMLITHLIGFINSAVNPFIYHAMNEKFRKSFRNIFLRVFCCLVPLFERRRRYSWSYKGCDRGQDAVNPWDSSDPARQASPVQRIPQRATQNNTAHPKRITLNKLQLQNKAVDFTYKSPRRYEHIRTDRHSYTSKSSSQRQSGSTENYRVVMYKFNRSSENSSISSSSNKQCPCKDMISFTGSDTQQHGQAADIKVNLVENSSSSVTQSTQFEITKLNTRKLTFPPAMPCTSPANTGLKRAVSAPCVIALSIVINQEQYTAEQIPTDVTYNSRLDSGIGGDVTSSAPSLTHETVEDSVNISVPNVACAPNTLSHDQLQCNVGISPQ